MLNNFYRIALRRLWADKMHTAINVLGLALGMACCLVIYTFVQYESNFDAFHTHADQTYRVVQTSQKADGVQHWPITAYPLAEAIRSEIPGVIVTQTAGPISRIISATDDRGTVQRFEEKRLLFADENYLQTFDFSKYYGAGLWIAGNAQSAFQQPNAVVLTQKSADRYFAGYAGQYEKVLGKTLSLNNKDALVVSGVIRNPPSNTNLLFDLLVNYQFFKNNNPFAVNNWSGNYEGMTYLTLPKGVTSQAIEAQLSILKKKYMNEEDNRRVSYLLQPLAEVHTEPLYKDALAGYVVSREMLWGLSSLAVFLILIASFNFINLATAQAIRRRKEVGIRKMAGSTRTQLFFQFIGETLLLTVLAGVIAVGGLELLLPLLNRSLTIINLDLHPDVTVCVFGAAMIGAVALLAGFYPALVLSKSKPIATLKNTTAQVTQGFGLRQWLITLQFCITYALLVGTLVASRQMDFFQNKSLGFTKDAVITVNGPRNQVPGKLDLFRQQLQQNPAIKAVSFSSGAPITANYYGTDFRLKPESIQMNRQAEMKVVDLAYSSLFGLQMIAGAWFSQTNVVPNGAAFNGLIVNETLLKSLDLSAEEAIGKTLVINEGEAPILGVVKDFHNVSLQQAITPCVLMCWNTGFYEQIHIQMLGSQTASLGQILASIEQEWKYVFPQDVYQYTFLDESLAKGYVVEQLVFDAFQIFAAISIFVSCMGLFGLIAFMAEQRTKEIGIRKVLGASVAGITGLLAKDFLKLVLIAIVIASPIAYYCMQRWLADFEYHIAIQWWMFALASLVALLIAFLTVGGQAIKAALANPVKSLRSE